MKKVFVFLCFIMCVFELYAQGVDGKKLLNEALQYTRICSYQCTMVNPVSSRGSRYGILPYGNEWKYYRLFQNDNLKSRLEILNGKKETEVYIKNDDGVFGIAFDSFTAEIIEVPYLWYPELIHDSIDQIEMDLCACSVKKIKHNNIPCYLITLETPSDDVSLMKITYSNEATFSFDKQRFQENRVFIREFIVGEHNKFIYARRHYNLNGELIFDLDLGNVSFHDEFPESIFATPDNVSGKFIIQSRFAAKAMKEMYPSRIGSVSFRFQKIETAIQEMFESSPVLLSFIVVILGIVFVSFGFFLKFRKK